MLNVCVLLTLLDFKCSQHARVSCCQSRGRTFTFHPIVQAKAIDNRFNSFQQEKKVVFLFPHTVTDILYVYSMSVSVLYIQ